MSGETKQKEIEKYTAGVGFVIDNNFAKYVEDVIPHTHRIIQLKLKGTCNINVFSIYLPPATITKSEEKNWTQFKEDVYQKLEKIQIKQKAKDQCISWETGTPECKRRRTRQKEK